MSDTHYEINKRLIYKVSSFVAVCLISLVIYIYQTDWSEQKESDRIQSQAIQTSQRAIEAQTIEIVANRQEIAVEKKRADGHEDNPVAHTN